MRPTRRTKRTALASSQMRDTSATSQSKRGGRSGCSRSSPNSANRNVPVAPGTSGHLVGAALLAMELSVATLLVSGRATRVAGAIGALMVTAFVSVLGVGMAATSAYAFSRFRFRGRNVSLIFLLTTQMIPAGMLLIPIYLFLARAGLLDTYKGLILAYVVSSIPFSIWILKGYYDTVPVDLEEAAMIDGASRIGTFLRIILPLSTPALAIVFLFNFMQSWQEFPVAYQVVQRNQFLWTWPLGIKAMQGQFQTEWGMYAAASVLIIIPVLALFLYSAKWLISGLTLGSVKG